MYSSIHCSLIRIFLFLLIGSSSAVLGTIHQPHFLLTNIDRYRSTWQDQGFEVEFAYIADFSGALTGGVKTGGTYLQSIDIITSLDLKKTFGWPGATVLFYGQGNHGGDPSAKYTGDTQGFNNIEADDNWRLYSFYIQQKWAADRFSALFGFYDLNSEFDVREAAGLFINSSQGIGPDLAQMGKDGPSIFPKPSLGFRLRGTFPQNLYMQVAAFNDVAGGPESAQHPLETDDGLFFIGEIGYQGIESSTTKYGIGLWRHSGQFIDLRTDDKRSGNWGAYALAESAIYINSISKQQLTCSGRLGIASPIINQFSIFGTIGLIYNGLFTSHPEDQLGLALALATNGKHFNQARQNDGLVTQYGEWIVEFTYRHQSTSWWSIQPNLQYIIYPGEIEKKESTLAFVLRSEFIF